MKYREWILNEIVARSARQAPGDSLGKGAMVALLPVEPETLAVPEGLTPDDIHVTLRFLGGADDFSEGRRDQIRLTAGLVANEWPEFQVGMDWQIAHFGGQSMRDEGWVAVVAEWPHDDETLNLIALQADLAERLDRIDAKSASQFPWKPHLTLGYFPVEVAKEQYPEGLKWPHEPLFDRMAVKFGEDEVVFPLKGS